MSVLTDIRVTHHPHHNTANTPQRPHHAAADTPQRPDHDTAQLPHRDATERAYPRPWPRPRPHSHPRPKLLRLLRYPSRRSIAVALTAAGLAMLPWLFVLATTLPKRTTAQHWNTAWVGLDSLEALGLTCTGVLLYRRDSRAGLTAAATATLLLVDAWFDVLTAAPGTDRIIAVLMAAGAELPIAALCVYLAVRLFPSAKRAK